ncbi:hypothetical protein ACIHJG_37165 [Streptomyces sp. NPDC052415]|uniref:hypothetical protein n=1 Tax=Streptomyces sp. NPDC052415 TaxID=3365690 RepID=UPI0037D04108
MPIVLALALVLGLVLVVGAAMVLVANPKQPFFRQFFGTDRPVEQRPDDQH